MSRRLVLGIGTGRCGSVSLAALLNAQPGVLMTHELQPPNATDRLAPMPPWAVDEDRFATAVEAIERLPARIVGDVGHYWLPYLARLVESRPGLRVVCLQREREEVVASFLRKVSRRHGVKNHWVLHDGSLWLPSLYDETFPSYSESDLAVAIGRYWDEYEWTVTRLQRRHGDRVRRWSMEAALNTPEGRAEVLRHAGVPERDQVLRVTAWRNRSSRGEWLMGGPIRRQIIARLTRWLSLVRAP